MSFSNTISVNGSPTISFEDIETKEGFVNLQVKNTGDNDLTAFNLYIKNGEDGDYVPFIGGADWASSDDIVKFCSTNTPDTLAAGETAIIIIFVGAADGLGFQVNSSGETTVEIKGSVI